MSSSDLDAVVARRQTLARELAKCDAARADLMAEDVELQVTERVLIRLTDYCRSDAPEAVLVGDEYPAERVLHRTTKALSGLVEGGLDAGKELVRRLKNAPD